MAWNLEEKKLDDDRVSFYLLLAPGMHHGSFFFERIAQDSASFIDIAEKIQVYSPIRL